MHPYRDSGYFYWGVQVLWPVAAVGTAHYMTSRLVYCDVHGGEQRLVDFVALSCAHGCGRGARYTVAI